MLKCLTREGKENQNVIQIREHRENFMLNELCSAFAFS